MTSLLSSVLAVTTAIHPRPEGEAQAEALAAELTAPFVPRLGRSLEAIFAVTTVTRLHIVGSDRLRLRDRHTGTEYFFHPNLFLVRGCNFLRGVPDHFLEAADLRAGDRLLDCTLGFASEASLAALAVGETGSVIGLESVPELAVVTRIGLQSFPMKSPKLESALRRVQVVTADYRDYLRQCRPGLFDVIYFDPFFHERLAGSEASVSPLFAFGNPSPLDPSAVLEAVRVAARCVVVKHPRHIALPEPLADLVTKTIGSRKSRLVYSVIDRKEAQLFLRAGVQLPGTSLKIQ